MLLVALDNLIGDYAKARRRFTRKGDLGMAAAAEGAITRYTELFHKVAK